MTDLVTVITTIFPVTSPLGTVLSMAQILQRAYTSALRASRGATPSLNEIHIAWNDALRALNSETFDDDYAAFVTKYRRDNADLIPADDPRMPSSFVEACQSYWTHYLPTPDQVQRAFTSQLIDTLQDTDWSFTEEYGSTGQAYVTTRFEPLGGTYGRNEGHIDDCPEDFMNGIAGAYNGKSVIELPMPIKITIWEVDLAQTELERTSSRSGDTSFRLLSGEQDRMDHFMRTRAYDGIMVSDLDHD